MESLRQVSPHKAKRKKKARRIRAETHEAPEDGGHMASAVMALLSSQAGDIIQAHKHLDASRMVGSTGRNPGQPYMVFYT